MSDKVEIKITGSNQTGPAFQGVARDAQKMGDTIDESGKRAGRSLEQLGKDADKMGKEVEQAGEKSAKSLKEVEDKAKAVGAGIGAMVLSMAVAGRAFQSQEQQIRGLNRSYGESAEEIRNITEAIQETTVYSNDAARQSAIYASSLIQNYGMTADQIGKLIQRSADLATVNVTAQGTQIELTDAVSRTSAALRGEAEAGELLGLSMSDTYLKAEALKRGLDGWSTTMTEAEKAQFRFTIMMEQSSYAMGAAAEAADTNAGKAKQLINTLQDQTQAFGGALGPMGEYLSVLGNIALAAPLAGAAIGKVVSGISAAGGASGLVKYGLPAAAVVGAGALAYGYSQDTLGTTQINQMANQFFMTMSSVLNELLPGNPYDTGKYTTQMQTNASWDAINALLQAPGMSQDAVVNRLTGVLGVPWTYDANGDPLVAPSQGGSREGAWIPPTTDEVLAAASKGAAAAGIPIGDYIYKMLSADLNFVRDPVSGAFVTSAELAGYIYNRDGRSAGSGATGSLVSQNLPTPKEQINWFPFREVSNPQADALGYGPMSPYTGPGSYYTIPMNGAHLFADPGANPQAWAARYGALGNYYGVPDPERTANRTATIDYYRDRTVTIDPLPTQLSSQSGNQSSMAAMGTQSVQIAHNMTAALEAQYGAYAVLFDGIMSANDAQTIFAATQAGLSAEMSVYQGQASEWTGQLNAQEAAYKILEERQQAGGQLTKDQTEFMKNYAAAVEIGTVAVEDATVAGGIAAQNMLLNKNAMDTFKAGTDGVTEAILLLIETLGGVPDDVRTKITLDGEAEMHAALDRAVTHLNNINGQTATFYINTQQTGVAIGNPNGPSIDNNPYRLHGGVVGYRNGGIPVELAEAGPELLHFRDGGSAWAMERGVYNVPKGTYVDTAPVSRMKAGGMGAVNNFYGSVTVIANNPQQFMDAMRESNIGGSRS